MLDIFFIGVTLLGTEGFYLLLLPVLVWCLNKGLGWRVALLVLSSTYLNEALKTLFQLPRPNPEVIRHVVSADGWGFPVVMPRQPQRCLGTWPYGFSHAAGR